MLSIPFRIPEALDAAAGSVRAGIFQFLSGFQGIIIEVDDASKVMVSFNSFPDSRPGQAILRFAFW